MSHLQRGPAVLIPVKAFSRAKVRLAPALSPPDRAVLARRMATHVVRAAAPLDVYVVCDDPEVRSWAESVGATSIWCPGTGLNGAVQRGVAQLAAAGIAHVVVTHSDLPLSLGFDRFAPWPGVTLVPDRSGTGTNVIAVNTALGFTFDYGVGSFRRHVREAVRLRAGLCVVHAADLAWDVDQPADLAGDVSRLLEGLHVQV